MAKDLAFTLENRPGTLADAAEALGQAGINIDGTCGFPCEDVAIGHVLVEDAGTARSALEGAGFTITDERDVLILEVEDRPGALGAVARRLADAGVNIDLIYLATNTRVVLGVDDFQKASSAI